MEITEQRILTLPLASRHDSIDVYKRTRDGKVDWVARTRKHYHAIAASPSRQDAVNTALNFAVLHLVCEAYYAAHSPPNRPLISRPLIAKLEEWELER